MGILVIEILLILLFVSTYIYFNRKTRTLSQLIIDSCFLALIFGTPILFTSITRSVFEVTKMFALRSSQLVIIYVLFINFVLGRQHLAKHTDNRLTYLLAGWAGVNLLSFLFSPNMTISFIGAYDRWDGILTNLNYVFLFYLLFKLIKEETQILWMITALLLSGFIASIYGITQSLGIDFMNWSVDPTARVFASINNPVHYSAYIAMLIPPIVCTLIYLIQKHQISLSHFNLAFFKEKKLLAGSLIVLGLSILTFHYTANYISFGRGTWIGFSTAIMFLYFFLFKLYDEKKLYLSSVVFGLGMFLSNAVLVFKVHEFSKTGLALVLLFSTVFLIIHLFLLKTHYQKIIAILALLIYAGLLQFSTVYFSTTLTCLAMVAIFAWALKDVPQLKVHLTILTFFVVILFVPSYHNIWTQFKLTSALNKELKLIKEKTNKPVSTKEVEETRYQLVVKLFEEGKLSKTEFNVLMKTGQYATHLKTGTARTSMWRSAIGLSVTNLKDPNFRAWVKDYPLLGTGPSTIKVFFPKYRRPEYGRLEGGHNFTPDQLHNEYVNTIASRGLIGFVSYYLVLIPFCFYLFLRQLKNHPKALSNYLSIGLMSGVMVFMGQVMFNFGVVATNVLFYEILGLAMAIVLNNPFGDYQETPSANV
jgi:hypothetical protein